MSKARTVSKEEYEQLLAEIRELKEKLARVEEALLPLRLLAEHLPNLMADLQVFKAAAPMISMLNIMDNTDLNALGMAMMGGMSCGGEALSTGNAELGLVAKSYAISPKNAQPGSLWNVPQTLYQPIRQDAVLLTKGRDNAAAKAFLAFLKSDTAKAVIHTYGYGLM